MVCIDSAKQILQLMHVYDSDFINVKRKTTCSGKKVNNYFVPLRGSLCGFGQCAPIPARPTPIQHSIPFIANQAKPVSLQRDCMSKPFARMARIQAEKTDDCR